MARNPVLQPGGPRFLVGLPLLITLTAMMYPIRNPGYRVRTRNQVDPDRGSPLDRSLKRKRSSLEGRLWRAVRSTI
ncbi:hypothetical protein NC653_001908 [Populus alba x Populus x berolinensis]|uniref:Uncharacterized protein n=1 Tax=Populus alba x Populus x berolinensis TaxID=444605 RepID=A0AAD6RMB2_9ROSI|nr:hypothetical protein NC653_001908 [Populus alba x Populus x berolinensis]